VTTFEAMRYLDVYHCPARILQLRKAGHRIVTHRQTVLTEAGKNIALDSTCGRACNDRVYCGQMGRRQCGCDARGKAYATLAAEFALLGIELIRGDPEIIGQAAYCAASFALWKPLESLGVASDYLAAGRTSAMAKNYKGSKVKRDGDRYVALPHVQRQQ
jgi:hypothetical protein